MHTILSDSWIIKTTLKLYSIMRSSWNNSFFMYITGSIVQFLKASINSSTIVSIITRESSISTAWENCLIRSIIVWLLMLPEKVFKLLYKKIKGHFSSSIAYKVLAVILDKIHLLTAIMLFISLVAPFEWNNLYASIMLIILTFLLFLKPAVTGAAGVNRKIISFYAVVFALAIIAAQIFSTSPADSLRFFAFYANCFMIVLLIGSISTKAHLQSVIEIVLLGITITGLLGIWVAITGVPVNQSLTDTVANPDMPGRTYSTIKNTNDYAESLIIMLPFYLAVVLYTKSFLKKLLFIIMAAPTFIALILTYTRTSWIGFAFGILIFMFFANRKLVLPLIALGLLSIPFLPQTITNRIATIATGDTSIDYRFKILKTIIPVIKDNWLSGIGLGTDVFKEVVKKYPLYTGGNIPVHSHNIILHVWIESGVVGALSFIGWMVHLFKTGINNIRNQKDKAIKYVIIASISSISGAAATGMGEHIWHEHRVMLLFWAVIGILASAISQKNKLENIEKNSEAKSN